MNTEKEINERKTRRPSQEQLFVKSYLSNRKRKFQKTLKNSKVRTFIFINEDFCHETMQYRKELWEEGKRLLGLGKIVYLNYRSVVVKERRGQGE